MPADQQEQPCLADEEIDELARLACRVEDHYGSPQDIEWAIVDGEGAFLLQSRPETVWAGREAAPVAAPKERAYDHVFDLLRGGSQ